MHGVIFTSLRDFVTAEHGAEVAKEVFDGEPVYELAEAYPDERFADLLRRTCEATGIETDELERRLGSFTAQTTFARLYPAYFAISRTARDFILTVETRIHELVRATIPNAGPPQLDVSPLGVDGVVIVYDSPRQLCFLLRGLVEGTARHYGEQAEIDETACMRRGDRSCRFEVRFIPAVQSV
jgi:hypothetical protein